MPGGSGPTSRKMRREPEIPARHGRLSAGRHGTRFVRAEPKALEHVLRRRFRAQRQRGDVWQGRPTATARHGTRVRAWNSSCSTAGAVCQRNRRETLPHSLGRAEPARAGGLSLRMRPTLDTSWLVWSPLREQSKAAAGNGSAPSAPEEGCVSERLKFRSAVNVPDALTQDKLIRRMRRIRAGAVLDKNTIEYWNRGHPDEKPIDTAFEDSVIAWCDGTGPLPKAPV